MRSNTTKKLFLIRIRTRSKGFALISVLFVTFFSSAMTLSLASLLSNTSVGSIDNLQAEQAASVAEGGLHYILMREFMSSTDLTAVATASNVALGAGQFSVTYSNQTATSADITVTAQVQNSQCQIQQHVVKQYGTGSAISGVNVDLTSSQSGGGSVTGPANYVQSFESDEGYVFSSPATQGAGASAISLASLLAMTTSTVNGDYTVPDGFNGYVHVTGNATISGDRTVTGIIVADGNIDISGNNDNLTINGTLAAGGNITTDFKTGTIANLTAQAVGGQMQPLLLAVGNINFTQKQDSVGTFKGLIWAGGNITIDLKQRDKLYILGSLIANGNVTVDSKQSSGMSVNYGSGSFYLPSSLLLSNWKRN